MKRDNKQKMIIAVALILVLSVGIGFATFSTSLRIKSGLNIDAGTSAIDPTTFSVVFSSDKNTLSTNAIVPTKSDDIMIATKGEIDNSLTYPTLKNIGATFTKSGQSVTYKLYSLNNGEHNAYLTSIVFNSLNSGSFIECTAGDGATQSVVDQACRGINVSVQITNTDSVTTTATSTMLGIEDHTLDMGESEVVLITFSYNSSVTLDGPFDISVGNIYLTYGNQMTSDMPELSGDEICASVDTNKSGSTIIGTEYKCAVNDATSYNFYVLSTSGDNVSLLMKQNLVDDVFFSTENSVGPYESYYSYVSGVPYAVQQVQKLTRSWTKIPVLNETYTDLGNVYIVTLTGRARLPKVSELTTSSVCSLRQTINYRNEPAYYGCPTWALGDYWTMDMNSSAGAWAMNTKYNTLDDFMLSRDNSQEDYLEFSCFYPHCFDMKSGIRPVITVDKSALG